MAWDGGFVGSHGLVRGFECVDLMFLLDVVEGLEEKNGSGRSGKSGEVYQSRNVDP